MRRRARWSILRKHTFLIWTGARCGALLPTLTRRQAADDARAALLRRLGLSLVAPPAWVAFYPFAGGAWALMNLAEKAIEISVTGAGGKAWNGTIAARGWVVNR